MLVGQGASGAARRGRAGRRAARRRRRQGAQRPRRAARRPALRHRLDRPARHQALQRHDGGLRHAAHGRLELPVLGVAARARAGARRADRHRRAADRHALPDGGQPRRRRRAPRCGRCSRCSSARRTASWREEIEAERRRAGGRSSTTGRTSRPTRSTRSSSSTSSPSACPTARSSPPTPARRRTGGRGTCGCAAGMHAALSGHARDDVPGGPVRAGREVRLSRPARDRASSATARCRCSASTR